MRFVLDTTKTRKSTRERSDMLAIRSDFPLFFLQPDDLDSLEGSIGVKMPKELRDKVKHILDLYFFRSEAALAAPFALDVQQELATIRTAAQQLKDQLNNLSSAAKLEAAKRIEDELQIQDPTRVAHLNMVCNLLDNLSMGCEKQIEKSTVAAGFQDGHEEWNAVIVKLRGLFYDYRLPIGVSYNNNKPSRFVAFMAEVHRIMPNTAVKLGTQSFGALAQAMKRAITADRDRKREAASR